MPKKALLLYLVLVVVNSILSAQQSTAYELGLNEYLEGRYLEAIELFEEHIRVNPTDSKADDANWRIGRALVKLDRTPEAELFFREVSSKPGNRQDDAIFDLGELLYDAGNLEESLEMFGNLSLNFPESGRTDDALWYIGEIQMAEGRVDEAESAYRKVIENTDSNRRDEALYSLGYLLYSEHRNEEAMESFNTLIAEYPDDSKIDDSMWRIGRLHMRADRDDLAEVVFLEILDLPTSNRFDEASYDLGRIQYYTHRDYKAVTDRFSVLIGRGQIGLYQRKGVLLGANAYYSLGLQARREYRDQDASEYFTTAIRWLEYLLMKEDNDAVRADILIDIGKSHGRLYELSTEKDTGAAHGASAGLAYSQALELLDDSEKDDVIKRLSDIQRTESPYTTYDITALGGYETLVSRPGARIYVDILNLFPVSYRNRLSAEVNFKHEDLTIKTFNFDPGQTGTDRLISRNDTLGLDLGWRSGSDRTVRNDLNVITSYRWAENPSDNRFLAAIEDTLRWQIDSNWRLDTDLSATLKIYPNYLSGSNKIDSFTPALGPKISYYGVDWLAISLAYEFYVKQYLQSTYGGSSSNKQYITNSAALQFRKRSGVFRPLLKYEIAWLQSNNYDLTINGSPAPIYVTNYWDNLTHSFRLDLDFRWSSRFRTNLSGTLDYRSFSNYPARDNTNTFTGEMRKDLGIEISLDIDYEFWTKSYTSASGVLQASWVRDSSNMLYENSIATNFNSFGVYAGVNVKRR